MVLPYTHPNVQLSYQIYVNYKLLVEHLFCKFCLLKTKFIFYQPCFVDLLGNQVEVVTEFKLLGVTIDEKLTFTPNVKFLWAKENQKLFTTTVPRFLFILQYQITFFKYLFLRTMLTPHLYFFIFFLYLT